MVDEIAVTRFDTGLVEINIYTEQDLEQDNGRVGEKVAARYMNKALEFGEVNHIIRTDLPLLDYPPRNSVCDTPFQQWNQDVSDGNIPRVAPDSNVLLIDGRGGGCSNNPKVEPGRCTVGFRNVDTDMDYELTGRGMNHGNINALQHEVAHNLGMFHSHHGGFGFVDRNNLWNRSPEMSGGTVNQCGEPLEQNPGGIQNLAHHYYHWCSLAQMETGPNERPPGVPSEYPPSHDGRLPANEEKIPRPPDPSTLVDLSVRRAVGGENKAEITYTVSSDSVAPVEVEVETSSMGASRKINHKLGVSDSIDWTVEFNFNLGPGEGQVTDICSEIVNSEYI